MNRFLLHVLSFGFSVLLGALLLFPNAARTRQVRWLIKGLFGRLLAQRYDRVIALYGSDYGLALSQGFDAASSLARRPIETVVDCGTGTGFVTQAVARRFASARILSVDAVPAMLLQARQNFEASDTKAALICGDISSIPLRDGCADLVVAQNTMPYLQEFARVCAPGGVVLFVDSSARLVTGVAASAAEKTGAFAEIRSGAVATGFYLCAERRSAT